MNWEYDHEVFQEITRTGSNISLELNTSGIGANGRDITGRTVIRAIDKSTSVSAEFIVNVTGELKSVWFEDPSTGSRLSSIMTAQKETVTLRIGTYPRAAQNFELIGENDPDNPDIATIVVDSAAKEAIIETQKPGTAHLKVSTTDDRYSSTIQVTVSEMVLPDTTPSKIVINGGDFMEISTRDTTSSLSVSVYDQYNKDITDQSLIEWHRLTLFELRLQSLHQPAFNRYRRSRCKALGVSESLCNMHGDCRQLHRGYHHHGV